MDPSEISRITSSSKPKYAQQTIRPIGIYN